jgi:uncharacterized membrane protein
VKRFRPLHAILLVALVLATVLGAERLITGGRGRFERVGPDARGEVRIEIAGFRPGEVRFYRFLNSGNQEVRFFAGLDPAGAPLAAFDASDNDYKMNRGFSAQDGWIVNNKCTSSFRLAEVNSQPSGCAPVPLAFRLEGGTMVLAENAVLEGWRYFR